ncbi:MAG: DUF2127 domain-containing protein [Gammaproteobacteria bacterium]
MARAWAEWLVAISGSSCIPFEIYELTPARRCWGSSHSASA